MLGITSVLLLSNLNSVLKIKIGVLVLLFKDNHTCILCIYMNEKYNQENICKFNLYLVCENL